MTDFISPTEWKKKVAEREREEREAHRGSAQALMAKVGTRLASGYGTDRGNHVEVILDEDHKHYSHPDIAILLSEMVEEEGWDRAVVEKGDLSSNPVHVDADGSRVEPVTPTIVRLYTKA